MDEFVNGCMRLSGQANSIDMATLISDTRRLMTKVSRHMKLLHNKVDGMRSSVIPSTTMATLHCCQMASSMDKMFSQLFVSTSAIVGSLHITEPQFKTRRRI